MNVLTKVNEVRDCVIKKAVPLSISAVAATQALMISAFAEEAGGSTVDISAVTDAMTTSLSDLVSKVGIACAGVVGAALSVFALKFAIRTIKSFFSKISS